LRFSKCDPHLFAPHPHAYALLHSSATINGTEAASSSLTAGERASSLPAGDVDVFIVGRVGHADCINGRYAMIEDKQHDGHPVFRHIDPIPPGFANDSGKHLWLMYHGENDAWAIATEFARFVKQNGKGEVGRR
jgi:hypothetical protein